MINNKITPIQALSIVILLMITIGCGNIYAHAETIKADSVIIASELHTPTGRTATFVVAASDSSVLSKAQADYVCDGIDDDVQIQAAINALPANGGHVYLLNGRYVLSNEVNLNKEWLKISGSCGTQIDLDHSGGKVRSAFNIQNNHIEIYDINFEFTDTTVLGQPPLCIQSNASNDEYEYINIHDCSFTGINTAGTTPSGSMKHTTIQKAIDTAAGKHWSIKDNFFKGCSWEGVCVGNHASTNYPEHIIITGNDVVGFADRCYGGIVVEHGAKHCVIANNNIRDMGDIGGYGIYAISGDSLAGSDNIVITGNSITNVAAYGIYILENTGIEVTGNVINGADKGMYIQTKSKLINVVGNTILDVACGIGIGGDSHNILILGNTISDAKRGVDIEDSMNVKIVNNDISYCRDSGIDSPWTSGSYTASNIFISGNVINNCNTGGGTYSHIYLDSGNTVNNIVITNNILSDTQTSCNTTTSTGANIGKTTITVNDANMFMNRGAIRIGTTPNHDDVVITDVDYFTNVITFSPALTKNHASESSVVGQNTFYEGINNHTLTIRNNQGFITENSGTTTLVNGQTSIIVNHGLDIIPSAGDIMVTPIEAWGNMTSFYIDIYTATQFTIHADQNPSQDVDFAWKAVVL